MADYNIENLKFLIVDDDPNMRLLVTTILTSLGVKNISAAPSVDAGFGMLHNFEADIVICDLRMAPRTELNSPI